MVGLVLDAWPGFYCQGQRYAAALGYLQTATGGVGDFVGNSFESIIGLRFDAVFFVILAGCFCPKDLQKTR